MHLKNLIKQKPYEHVVHVLRRHWITLLPFLFLYACLFFLPVAVSMAINIFFATIFESTLLYTATVLCFSLYYLGLGIFFLTHFVDFYLDIWIITNDRIIDIEQFGLFSRTISELDLFQIQDATSEVHGIFATFFGYGNVIVKTASNNAGIVFHNVPQPNKIREDLIALSDEDRKYHGLAAAPKAAQ